MNKCIASKSCNQRSRPLSDESQPNLIELTADIVSAYVQKNALPVAGLPDLIANVNLALAQIRNPAASEQEAQKPAVNPKRSVFPDYIV
ncbi:MAG: hypothetical protein E5X90_15370, partial [Mesorhizobium sp.]